MLNSPLYHFDIPFKNMHDLISLNNTISWEYTKKIKEKEKKMHCPYIPVKCDIIFID